MTSSFASMFVDPEILLPAASTRLAQQRSTAPAEENDELTSEVSTISTRGPSSSEVVGHMEEEVERRRQRLLQLRKRRAAALQAQKRKSAAGEDDGEEEEEEGNNEDGDALPHAAFFRNYKPQSETLKQGELLPAETVSLEPEVKEQLEAGQTKSLLDEVNLTNLAPRKPDWDLKRAVEKNLKKLERRTQRAIVELIRERLQSENTSLTSFLYQQE